MNTPLKKSESASYPDECRIAEFEQAIRKGQVTFEEGGGWHVHDLSSPFAELGLHWPDDLERETAMWRVIQRAEITDEMVLRAARKMHSYSGHRLPSGRLSRWDDDLTNFQRVQFCNQAYQVLLAALEAAA